MEIQPVSEPEIQPVSEPLRAVRGILARQRQMLEPLYEDFQRIGAGKFGDVFRCRDRLTQQDVAVKIITIPENEKRNGLPCRIIREVSILKELDHINVVRLLDVLGTEDDVYLVFEYLDLDLHKFVTNTILYRYPRLVKNFLHQILSGVAYCHSQKILHRDLKPQNILIHFRTHVLKIADFGVARTFEVPLSSYSSDVGSPCYRAPEILFGCTDYSTPIDMWSVGCIFVELLSGKPLFVGQSEWDILHGIFSVLGTPTEETWPGLSSVCNFMEALSPPMEPKDLIQVVHNLNKVKGVPLDPIGADLLSRLLCVCPAYRISAEEAVVHPYLDGI